MYQYRPAEWRVVRVAAEVVPLELLFTRPGVGLVYDDYVGGPGRKVAFRGSGAGVGDDRPIASTPSELVQRSLMLDAGLGVFIDHLVEEYALRARVEFQPLIDVLPNVRRRTL